MGMVMEIAFTQHLIKAVTLFTLLVFVLSF